MLLGQDAKDAVRNCAPIAAPNLARAVEALSSFAFVGLTSSWYPSLCLFRALAGDSSASADGHVHRSGSGPAAQLFWRSQHPHPQAASSSALSSSSLSSIGPSAAAPSSLQAAAASSSLASPSSSSSSLSADAILDGLAFSNPRCEGLAPHSDAERLCATARVLPPSLGSVAVYRTAELLYPTPLPATTTIVGSSSATGSSTERTATGSRLVRNADVGYSASLSSALRPHPPFVDCADEIVYRYAALRRATLARRALAAGARLVYELRAEVEAGGLGGRGGMLPPLPAVCERLARDVDAELVKLSRQRRRA